MNVYVIIVTAEHNVSGNLYLVCLVFVFFQHLHIFCITERIVFAIYLQSEQTDIDLL